MDVLKHGPFRPKQAFVLGSGFHGFSEMARIDREIPYSQLPGFPVGRVDGHQGKVLFATVAGIPVLILCGRAHFYEGFSMEEITVPIRTLADFGIESLLLTNAAGGINPKFAPGDFMLVSDHVNFMGVNPLCGVAESGRERFVDLSQVYNPALNKLLLKAARLESMRVHSGIYIAVSGPSYETPAEIRAFRRLGADAVGMSTVPEAVVARQCGMSVAALSCISNLAAGRRKNAISHAEVLAMGQLVQEKAGRLLSSFARLVNAAETTVTPQSTA